MKQLKVTTQYNKDYKRYRHNPDKLKRLFSILLKLQNEEPIPAENRPHTLAGSYANCMECHIESDFLLIWSDPLSDSIILLRLGSHSELFE